MLQSPVCEDPAGTMAASTNPDPADVGEDASNGASFTLSWTSLWRSEASAGCVTGDLP